MHFSFMQKLGASFLIALWVITGANMMGDLLVHVEASETPALKMAAKGSAEKAQGRKRRGKRACPAGLGQRRVRRQDVQEMQVSATPPKKAARKVGPNLWDVVGRPKASQPPAQVLSGVRADLGGAWTYQDLDKFLTSPKAFAKGNKMTFKGLKKAAARAAVIAYLRSLSDQPKPLP